MKKKAAAEDDSVDSADQTEAEEEEEDDSSPSRFPKHWGPEPQPQTRDYRELPGGYGMGSSTLARWIQKNLDKDAAADAEPPSSGTGDL